MTLAWGQHVSPEFRARATSIAHDLGCDGSALMACMAFESGETFDPAERNAAGSGATGLIQFMPQTAAALGTSTIALARMTAERQLDFVARYFAPWKGRLENLGDLYMAILWPAGVGKPDSAVLFDRADVKHPKLYLQNKGLDFDHNGRITRGEACRAVAAKLAKGLKPEHAG